MFEGLAIPPPQKPLLSHVKDLDVTPLAFLDPRQRETVERYLLDPERGPAELHTFAGLFPNANFMLSNNLLTRNDPPSRDMLVRRDRETLNTVEAWLRDERFQKTRPELERIRSRLVDFLDNGGR